MRLDVAEGNLYNYVQVMKYLDSQPTARQSRASVSAAISALRPPQLETASGDELSEAEQLAVVNLPAMTLIDLHLVVEDAIGRLGGEEAAAGLVDTLNEIMFEPEAASLSETSTDWNNHHGSAPSTSALVSEFDSKESSAASASSASKGGNVADAASGGDDDSAAGNKKKGRRKRPRKR